MILLISTSCDDPQITVCISDVKNGGLQCSKSGAKKYLLTYDKTDNYICLPPDDARTLLEKYYNPDGNQ